MLLKYITLTVGVGSANTEFAFQCTTKGTKKLCKGLLTRTDAVTAKVYIVLMVTGPFRPIQPVTMLNFDGDAIGLATAISSSSCPIQALCE